MKLKQLLAAAAFAIIGVANSFAATYNITGSIGSNTNPGLWITKSDIAAGSFSDTYNFDSVTSSFNFDFHSFTDISNFTATLNNTTYNFTALGANPWSEKTWSGTFALTGANTLTIAGTFTAGNTATGGYYGSITPVPEPETYAMLLGGLGMIGMVARRRRNQGSFA